MAFTNSNDEICESSKKLAEQLKGLDQELIDNEIFVSVPGSESEFILGPCFKTKIPSELSRFYPLAEGERLFNRSLEPDRYIGKTVRSWPTVNRTWIDWVDRVAKAKGKVWKSAGIYDAIHLSKIDIPMDKNLLYAALFFWSVSTNSFHFRFGMMGPTVLDIVALTGFMPHGDEVSAVLSALESSEDFGMRRISDEQFNYCKFLDVSMGAVAVTEEEHISFLVTWLSKYLICNSSPGMMKELTKLAFALSAGRKLALAPLVLSSLYHVCRDIIMNEFDGGGGPLWILQFWIQSYFPEYGPLMSDTVNAPTYGYPLAKGVLRAKTFNQCFTFFLTCSFRTASLFTPFSSGSYGPEWFKRSLDPNKFQRSLDPKFHKLQSKELNDIWASYLIPRDLILLVDGSPNCKCKVEHYNPNQFARQFGMTQAVPLPLYHAAFQSQDCVEEADCMFDKLKRKFCFVSFKVNPKSTEFFDSWWSAYIRSTQTSSPSKIMNKTPPTIVNLSSHAMRARHEQSAAEHASNKKMKFEGNSVCSQTASLNRRKTSHNKAVKPSIKKGNTQTFKKTSKPSTHQESPLGKTMVKSVPAALYSSKPSVETVVQEKMDKGTSVLDDDTPSLTSSFTSEEEVETTMAALADQTGGKFSISSAISDEAIKLDNVEDFFAKVETQIKKAQSLSFSACHSPPMDDEQSGLNMSPPSAEMLDKAKDNISRFLLMPFQDVLAAENFSTLNSALSTYTAATDNLSIDTTFVLKKLKTSLPDLCSSFRRAKKDQEEFYTKSAKKVLLVDELKKGQELYHDLKDNHDKLDSTMDSIKNQIKELKTSWKEAKMKKKAIQVQKLSLAKDCFTKCSALDEMEAELPAMEQKKEVADSDIARVEASWADFKHKLMESSQP